MTKTLRILTLTSLAVLAANAVNAADPKPYVSLKAGYADSDRKEEHKWIDYKWKTKGFDGYVGAIAGGAAFEATPFVTLRGELEYAYSSIDEKKTTLGKMCVDKHTFMVNGYADLGESSWVIKPYIGAGLGYGFGEVNWKDLVKEDLGGGLVYAGMLGVSYSVNSNWTLDLGAKYSVWESSFKDKIVRYTDRIVGEKLDTTLTETSYLLGVRYSF